MKENYSLKNLFLPKKKLGQNFLFQLNYLQKIVACCRPINSQTVIIEIGSGYGNLTNLLAITNCQKIISCEKDKQLFEWLVKNNKNKKKIIFLHQDALLINWPNFCAKYKNNPILVVGNLPYYIANSLIVNLLINYSLFKSLIFLVQKEVACRWVASPSKHSNKYSALSVFINYLAETELPFTIPASSFTPSPNVEGALVVIKIRSNINLSPKELQNFLRLLKNCFRFRRKTLWNNLNGFAGDKQEKWQKYFAKKNYSRNVRPQNLTPNEYFSLFSWQNL